MEWNVCYAAEDGNRSFRVILLDADLTDVSIGPDETTHDRATGVVVSVGDLHRDYKAFGSAEGIQELTETFALYLENYRDVRLTIAGERIDPAKAIASRTTCPLPPILSDGAEYAVDLEIVEWKRETKRTLYLCSSSGFSTVDGVRWHFWLVSNAYDDYAKSEMETGPDRERRLIAKGPRHIVGIKTWGELIEENRARLQFFQEHLKHSADNSAALKYLHERHSKLLEGVIELDNDDIDRSEAS